MLLELLLVAQVVVSWNYAAGQEIPERIFEVERSPSGCTQWELIAINQADVMSLEDIDVPGNCYRVRAVDEAGKTYPYSNIGTVPPAEPTPTPPPPCRPRGKSGKCK